MKAVNKPYLYVFISACFAALMLLATPVSVYAFIPDFTAPPAEVPARVIITNFEIEGGGIRAGETDKLIFTVKNTSTTQAVNSVLFTGSIDTTAPVQFASTNQNYVSTIAPNSEATLEFNLITKDVDLTSISSISGSVYISYIEGNSSTESSNNIMLQLPVFHDNGQNKPVDENIKWQPPSSNLAKLLKSRPLQIVYLLGIAGSGIGIVLILTTKRRKA